MLPPAHSETPGDARLAADRARALELSARLFPVFRFDMNTGCAVFFERDPGRPGACRECPTSMLPAEENIVRAELWIVYGDAYIGWTPGRGYFFEVGIEVEGDTPEHWSCTTLRSLDDVVQALSVPLVAYARMGAEMRPELIEAMTRLGLLAA